MFTGAAYTQGLLFFYHSCDVFLFKKVMCYYNRRKMEKVDELINEISKRFSSD
jgi:hypothetical protein